MQHPILAGLAGGRSSEAVTWDAHAEVALGSFIESYLLQNPAPAGSAIAHDLRTYGEALSLDGQARLEELGEARHLRAV